MSQVIQFVIDNAARFYLASLIGGAVALILLMRARRKQKAALFGLELELAHDQSKRAIRLLLVAALIAPVVLLINLVLGPTLPAQNVDRPTATPNVFITPPPTFSNITPSPTATLTPTLPIPSPTQPVAVTLAPATTPETTEPAVTPIAPQPTDVVCVFTNPADRGTVTGEVSFVGSAWLSDFGFYRLEVLGPQTGEVWASIIGDVVRDPVMDGVLGVANFGGWMPGEYMIRIVLVDVTSNEAGGCQIVIRLTDQ
jgi:hypothetical protein